MKTYLLLFRADYKDITKVSREEMQSRNDDWMKWLDSIASQGNLVGGNHLDTDGRIVKNNGVAKGTLQVEGTSVLGYMLVQSASYEDAVKIAETCPILGGDGNSVEVRELHSM